MQSRPPQLQSSNDPNTAEQFGTKEAATEFMAMALCDHFIGTAGSTVTYLAQAWNQKFTAGWKSREIIGQYDVPTQPTYNFRMHINNFLRKAYDHIGYTGDIQIGHEQHNVLDFLHPAHLHEIHSCLTNVIIENNGRCLGSVAGKYLIDNSTVASLNRMKFNQAQVVKAHSQHWLKALLKGPLKDYSSKTDGIEHHIDINDPNNILSLVRKYDPTAASSSSTPSGSESQPDIKRRRIQVGP